LKCIQLVAVTESQNISRYGMDVIIQPFMNKIKELEKTEGVSFTIHGNQFNFRGTLTMVVADNLASQLIGGYKSLNAAMRRCRFCMATSFNFAEKVYQ
jgi:hypothetical protein